MTLRVILQVVPYGDEDRTYEIGRLDIFNKGSARADDGTVLGGYHKYGVLNLTKNDAGMYEDEVLHRRWEGAWQLVRNTIETLEIKGP